MGLGTIISDLGEKLKKIPSIFAKLPSFRKQINIKPIRGRIKINPLVLKITAAAILIIIVLLIVLAVVSRPPRSGLRQADVYYDRSNDPIERETLPADDFFLPYEPDFIPDVLLEREPKESWTEEDSRPFWTNPLEGNEGVWRKRIESEIDSLLEHVP